MDDLLAKLQAFQPLETQLSDSRYDDAVRNQITTLGRATDKNLLLLTSKDESPLDVLDPTLNTVPYTYFLLAYMAAAQRGGKGMGWEKLWQKVTNFLESFDARQIRYVGKEFTHIIERAILYARSTKKPALAIDPIRNAILQLDPSGSMLTSTHLIFLKLVLETRQYEDAVPVIEKFIFQFPGTVDQAKPKFPCETGLPPTAYITPESKLTTKLTYQEVLEYFVYSGMAYIGLRKWESALECLENAITYPSKEVSKIMIEAYKKWILVSLLLEGKLNPLPRYTSVNAAKAYRTIAKPYDAVAQVFETGTASRLKAEVEAGQKIWQDDCNTGLMLHILSAYQKFQIRNLSLVYTKISTAEIHQLTTSAETGSKLQTTSLAEQLVRSMISEGSLDATLSVPPSGPAILTFMPSGPKLSETQMEEELRASKGRIQHLTEEVRRTDRMLTHNKEYVKFLQKQKKNAKSGMVDQGIGGDMDWNSMEDEDIMSGVVTY